MKIKYNNYKEAKIYIGSVKKDNTVFSLADLKSVIGDFQLKLGITRAGPVRIVSALYVWSDYEENGFEISVINYPRHPKSKAVINSFALDLATHLLEIFDQTRISIVFPDEIVMLEKED